MFIATNYLETKFKKSYKRGEVVPNDIAKLYPKSVTESKDAPKEAELLVETPSEIIVEVEVEVEETYEPKKKGKKGKK